MTPEEPKHITFVGDSSGWSLSADGTETRWETSGPDGHLGDENRRLRARVAALEGAIREHRDHKQHCTFWKSDEKLWALLPD